MTALEKQMKVKEILADICRKCECIDCDFMDKETAICGIRDTHDFIPCDRNWDMNSAMIGE